MNTFERFAYQQICQALAGIEPGIKPDIYVLSFFIDDFDGDPRRPTLQLGYNTTTRLAQCTPSDGQAPQWPIASDASEAKWNFAFWLQNVLVLVGDPETAGGQLWKDLLESKNLWYQDLDEDGPEEDFERADELAERITALFVDSCVRIAQSLHADGVIEQQFSHAVPIVVHELEYYDQIAAQTRAANPPGLASEFEDWVASM